VSLAVAGLMAGASLFYRMHAAAPTYSLNEFLATTRIASSRL